MISERSIRKQESNIDSIFDNFPPVVDHLDHEEMYFKHLNEEIVRLEAAVQRARKCSRKLSRSQQGKLFFLTLEIRASRRLRQDYQLTVFGIGVLRFWQWIFLRGVFFRVPVDLQECDYCRCRELTPFLLLLTLDRCPTTTGYFVPDL